MEVREKMTTYKEVIFDIQTGETSERPFTEEEIAQREANGVRDNAYAEAQAIKSAQRTALLERLGITAEEAKLLLL
jgi:hypothetical protein